jgi:hypothetical protein
MSTLRAVELIKTAAENITGFTFITGTRLLNNIEADDQRLPLIMLVRPLSIPVTIASGGRLRDSYQCLVIFASKSELEYQFALHEPIVGDMRLAADQFFVNLNSFSDYVQSISSITYADYINDFDANLTGVAATFTLELIPLDEQVCPTGTFVPEDLPPFSRYLTEVAVDGVTITGNGTTEDPLVAIGGGGGGGSLRVQDEGTTVTNAAASINFTGNVTASLASAGNVTVNVPAETPQVNADWNASSGVAQILNKPTLATVATSGSYTDLINQPSIPPAQVNSDWNAVSGIAEILNKPSIPAAQIQSDWNQANNAALDFIKNKPTIPSTSGLVPYTGATTNVDLGTHTLSAKDLVISHPSGSGVAASITKGGNGEALTVVKSSGSGNAASITGGVTLIDELHLTTDLADSYIASAATWNAKQNALSAGTGISLASNTVTNTAPDQTVVINAGAGIGVSGTYPNFTIANTLPALPIKQVIGSATETSGTAITQLSSLLIEGGWLTANMMAQVFARNHKVGANNGTTIRLYLNDANNLTGAVLLATFGAAVNGASSFSDIMRRITIVSATETYVVLTSTSSSNDIGNFQTSILNVNWATDKYLIATGQDINGSDVTKNILLQIEKYVNS